jgi:enamine deaminase RidA (YjgF/YER057c/UK114 family)
MNEDLQPVGVASAAAAYSLGMRIPAGSDLVFTAGIVPTAPDGTVPRELAAQAELVWSTIRLVLAAADMGVADIVSYTTYVIDGEDLSVVMAGRDAALNGHKAASTLIVVPRLARPEWRMEIAAVAAKSARL